MVELGIVIGSGIALIAAFLGFIVGRRSSQRDTTKLHIPASVYTELPAPEELPPQVESPFKRKRVNAEENAIRRDAEREKEKAKALS